MNLYESIKVAIRACGENSMEKDSNKGTILKGVFRYRISWFVQCNKQCVQIQSLRTNGISFLVLCPILHQVPLPSSSKYCQVYSFYYYYLPFITSSLLKCYLLWPTCFLVMIPFFFYLLLFEGLSLAWDDSLGCWQNSLAFQKTSKASDFSLLMPASPMAYLVVSLRPQTYSRNLKHESLTC